MSELFFCLLLQTGCHVLATLCVPCFRALGFSLPLLFFLALFGLLGSSCRVLCSRYAMVWLREKLLRLPVLKGILLVRASLSSGRWPFLSPLDSPFLSGYIVQHLKEYVNTFYENFLKNFWWAKSLSFPLFCPGFPCKIGQIMVWCWSNVRKGVVGRENFHDGGNGTQAV